jgi:hypothetical protein
MAKDDNALRAAITAMPGRMLQAAPSGHSSGAPDHAVLIASSARAAMS